MEIEIKQPSIYAYNDFKKFLVDYQVSRQKYEKTFTKSEFSRMLQLPHTRSYITDVLKGKRVSETFVERFLKVIGFSRDEARYFRVLVRFNQADNAEEREYFFEQLIALNKTPHRIIDIALLAYYGKWYNSAVRAMLEINDFVDDYAGLAKRVRPAITPNQAKKSIQLLLRLGLASRDIHGVIKPTDKAIAAPENIRDEMIRHYQFQCLSLAQKIMITDPKSIAFSLTNTISVSERGYKRLMRLLEQFQSQVRSLIHKDENKPDRVVQLDLIVNKLSR
jgi:uncharacterized protein (TIGR02147 family)